MQRCHASAGLMHRGNIWVRTTCTDVCVCVCVSVCVCVCVCTSAAARQSSWIPQDAGSTRRPHKLSPQSRARTSAPTLQTSECTYELLSLSFFRSSLSYAACRFLVPLSPVVPFSLSRRNKLALPSLFLVLRSPPSLPLSVSGRAAEQWRPRWLA